MNFKDLNINNPLLKALEDLEYIHPTPVQIEAFPVVMSGRDVVAIAQTGTGKTFAYLLPILRQLKYSEQRHQRVQRGVHSQRNFPHRSDHGEQCDL
jgi:ATP-dependent RNA helicase RhlE